ncbi:D-xylose 1-dehydrogenase (NADP(+)) 2-like protein [Cladobotryum mycophilum]|uniref:D-xylose 1-dehydrogenase (NADP(+), D-xylono-1,5-lactone-forming) n=1 Tax=Cladobotryum mycophilum TaxID=491253 RepID=A0ABR0SVR2_9HYPO
MLRWGILGTSFISDVVVRAIQGSKNSSIVAVFGRNEERLNAFATKHNIGTKYQTIDALLDDASVDVVYVGLPSHMHSPAVIAAAKKGKAILSEKSLATTMKDSHAMMEAVKEANVFFLEGLMYLSHPLMEKLASIVKSGVLGNIKGVSGYYAANIWKKANPLGMGTIYNLGCYPVSLLHFIIETAYGPDAFKARQVTGTGNVSTEGSIHVRDAALNVRFDAGVLATIQSTDSFGNDFSFAIQGDKARLRFKTNPWLPLAGDNIIELRTYGGATEEIVVPAELDAFGHQVKRVEECVAAGAKEAPRPSPSWANSVEIMSILTEWEEDIKKRSNVAAE